jgi:hypothetical protein
MHDRERISQASIREILLFGLVFLFFFQLLNDFILAIYAFGLLGASIPPEITAVLFLFSPILLIFLPRGISGRGLIWLGELLFAFNAQNVIARWTGASYPLIVIVLGLALSLFALLLAIRPRLLSGLSPVLLWVWNLAFIFCLVMTILAHQVRFPGDPGSYSRCVAHT